MSHFSYHQPQAYSYAVIDPARFRFAKSPHYRPPTPPVLSPPKDPNAPAEPKEQAKPANEGSAGDIKVEDTGDKPPNDIGIVLWCIV